MATFLRFEAENRHWFHIILRNFYAHFMVAETMRGFNEGSKQLQSLHVHCTMATAVHKP